MAVVRGAAWPRGRSTSPSISTRAPSLRPVSASVPAGSSSTLVAPATRGETVPGGSALMVRRIWRPSSRKATSIGYRIPIMCTCLDRLSHSPSPDGSSFVPRRPKSRVQWVSAQRSLLATTTPLVAALDRHHGELLAARVLHRRPLLADAGDGRVQPEPRLEADHHEVERVREDHADLGAAPPAHLPEPLVHDHVSDEPEGRRHPERRAERLAGGDP